MPDTNRVGSGDAEPGFGAKLIERVRALVARGQLGAAELLLPTLAKLANEKAGVARIEAEIALARGNTNHAADIIDRGLACCPTDGGLLILRAHIALTGRDFAGAARAAADAVNERPDCAEAKSLLGCALVELGKADQAAICLREALRAMPTHTPTLLALARAAPADAEFVLRARIAAGCSSALFRNALIRVLLVRQDLDAAHTEMNILFKSGEADIETRLLAVEAAGLAGNWAQAATFCDNTEADRVVHA